MKFALLISSCLMILSSFANPLDSVKRISTDSGSFVLHQVDDGETLYAISKRYMVAVPTISSTNHLKDNRINIGQVLAIPVKQLDQNKIEVESDLTGELEKVQSKRRVHVVKKWETLYSISKLYEVEIDSLMAWNRLSSTALNLEQELRVGPVGKNEKQTTSKPDADLEVKKIEKEIAFKKYLVQAGETLSSIADNLRVSLDSLKSWNDLRNDIVKIGQELRVKSTIELPEKPDVVVGTQKKIGVDEDGFERVYEEGVVSVIKDSKKKAYLALHKYLPKGTKLEIRNFMNNQKVYVKVVGDLPDTGINKGVLLRISQHAYEQLGILDAKARVEVSYYK